MVSRADAWTPSAPLKGLYRDIAPSLDQPI